MHRRARAVDGVTEQSPRVPAEPDEVLRGEIAFAQREVDKYPDEPLSVTKGYIERQGHRAYFSGLLYGLSLGRRFMSELQPVTVAGNPRTWMTPCGKTWPTAAPYPDGKTRCTCGVMHPAPDV
jgi:hypothetical protein